MIALVYFVPLVSLVVDLSKSRRVSIISVISNFLILLMVFVMSSTKRKRVVSIAQKLGRSNKK